VGYLRGSSLEIFSHPQQLQISGSLSDSLG